MHNYLIFFSSPRIPLIWTKNALSTASLHSFTAGSALDFHSPINHIDSQRQLTVAGGLLEASMMILDTVRRMAQRTRKIHKSCYFNELRAKSVASITGCGQTFTPPVGSPHQSDGSFPTNASLSVTSEDCISPAKALLVFIWLHLMEATQEAMFIFLWPIE